MNKYQEAFEDLCITWDEEGMGKDHFSKQYPYLYNTIKELVDKESKNQSELVENILCEFIYLDCNREINYKNMTGEQVVNDYNKVIERLLDRYNISLDNYYVRSDE